MDRLPFSLEPITATSDSQHADLVPQVATRTTTDLIIDSQMVPLLHEHPLIPFTRFSPSWCQACKYFDFDGSSRGYIYGGYRCNELECNGKVVFHKECVKLLQEINHSSHPHHSLKLIIKEKSTRCFCRSKFKVGYHCSKCHFKLDLACVRRPEPLVLPANSYGHEHPLLLVTGKNVICKACGSLVFIRESHYRCHQCRFAVHVHCADLFLEAYHISHPQHPLKSLKCEVPCYADKSCLLCGEDFHKKHRQLHHCDVCNFSICRACMKNPPPIDVNCPTTHEHQLRLVARRIDFTCNACGTQGDRSPYFCFQCNFMIHRQCIGLPRFINTNRHDHRIAYNHRLGHGEWKCRVCREKVDGFYGAYKCVKCPSLAVHSLCATNKNVWDMVEREGTSDEEETEPPFKEINSTTIKHFSHDHNLRINKDGHGRILPESAVCVACVFQICSEPFYECEECDFILHEKCAYLPRKKYHVRNNQPFVLHTYARDKIDRCYLCFRMFTGFRYKSGPNVTIDVRCGSTSDKLEHKSHQHPLYYYFNGMHCSKCGNATSYVFGCSECDYFLDAKCALLPEKVMNKRYDDHPLFLCFGDKKAESAYWCEACETKVDPKEWFYTCNDCAVTLHICCVVGDFSYIMPGSKTDLGGPVVSNNSVCRSLCSGCNSRCKLPSILKLSVAGDDVYICSYKCHAKFSRMTKGIF